MLRPSTEAAARRASLLPLATRRPAPAAVSAFDRLSPTERHHLLLFADTERVFTPVCAAVAEALGPDALPEPHGRRFEDHRHNRARLAKHVDWVARRLAAIGVPIVLLKGFGTEACYGGRYLRDFDDADLAVPSLEMFWDCAVALNEAGYVVSALVLGRRTGQAASIGVARVSLNDAGGDTCDLDFQIGAIPLHWFSEYSLDESFWSGALPIGQAVSVDGPSPFHAAVILLAESLEREGLTLRDVLDLDALASRLTGADIEALRGEIERLSLWHELSRYGTLARRLDLLCACTLVDRLQAPRSQRFSPSRRIGRALFHGFPYARRRAGLGRALGATIRSIAYDTAKLRLESGRRAPAVERLARRLDGRRLLEHGHFVPFLPLGPPESDVLRWEVRGCHDVLLSPIGALLPVPLGIVPADVSAEMMRDATMDHA